MTLENWRHINYIFNDILLLQTCFAAIYVSFLYTRLGTNFKMIYYYIVGNLCFDVFAKFVPDDNPNSFYFTYQDYFFLAFECYFLYNFFYNILKNNAHKKSIFGLAIVIIIFYLGYDFLLMKVHNSRFLSTLISFLNSLIILFCLHELSEKYANKKFINIPEAVICIMFLIAYTSLISIFFLLPHVTEYSRILANQLVLSKKIIGIIFTFSICYALKKSINYH
jgi:hypothetical protein